MFKAKGGNNKKSPDWYAQAAACADAGASLISPFVGRIMDWYKKKEGREFAPHEVCHRTLKCDLYCSSAVCYEFLCAWHNNNNHNHNKNNNNNNKNSNNNNNNSFMLSSS